MNIGIHKPSERWLKKRLFLIDLCDHIKVDGEYTQILTPCWGYFRKPSLDEIRTHSKRPFAMFQPTQEHGYNVTMYSMNDIINSIKAEIS